jgi:hypothetical protein
MVAGVIGDQKSGDPASSNQTGENGAPPNSHRIPPETARQPTPEVDGSEAILS